MNYKKTVHQRPKWLKQTGKVHLVAPASVMCAWKAKRKYQFSELVSCRVPPDKQKLQHSPYKFLVCQSCRPAHLTASTYQLIQRTTSRRIAAKLRLASPLHWTMNYEKIFKRNGNKLNLSTNDHLNYINSKFVTCSDADYLADGDVSLTHTRHPRVFVWPVGQHVHFVWLSVRLLTS